MERFLSGTEVTTTGIKTRIPVSLNLFRVIGK